MHQQWSSQAAAPDHAYFTLHKIVSNSALEGKPAIPPSASVDISPQAVPVRRHCLGSIPCSQPYKNPASKQSPAPVVSTDSIALASWKTRSPSHNSAAPFLPSFIATRRKPAICIALSIRHGSFSPVIASPSRSLGKKTSTNLSAASSLLSPYHSGCQPTSTDKVLPFFLRDANSPRTRSPASASSK